MFNERDRRCAAVQLMHSTDPSYDNRTVANTLKMQIRTVQRAQGDENKVSGYGYGLWCGFKWGPHHATSHLRSRLESQHQSVPGCAEECCYKTRSCLDLKNKKKGEKKKRKNGSYHFEFSTQNEKLVVHASAPRRTSVCDKLTKKKKNTLIDIQSERFPRGTKLPFLSLQKIYK